MAGVVSRKQTICKDTKQLPKLSANWKKKNYCYTKCYLKLQVIIQEKLIVL